MARGGLGELVGHKIGGALSGVGEMGIDKESSGVPEVDVHRRTTKVNLSMIAAIIVFFVIVFVAAFYFSRRAPQANAPAENTQRPTPPASEPSAR